MHPKLTILTDKIPPKAVDLQIEFTDLVNFYGSRLSGEFMICHSFVEYRDCFIKYLATFVNFSFYCLASLS